MQSVEADRQQAATVAATTRAYASTAGHDTQRARRALDEAEEALSMAETELAATALDNPDLASDDDALLAALAQAAHTARKAVGDAEAAAAGSEATLDAREAQLAATREAHRETAARLDREQTETSLAIARHRTALAGMPPRFRPAGQSAEELAAARDAAATRLAELRALRHQQEATAAALAQFDAAERALAEQRESRVLSPRRHATATVIALRAFLGNLEPPVATADPPGEQAALADHAAWIVETLKLAEAAADGLQSKQRELTEAAATAEAQVTSLLAEADRLDPEHAINDAAQPARGARGLGWPRAYGRHDASAGRKSDRARKAA